MLSILSKSILFITSYIPLYIILFVQYIDISIPLYKQPLLLTLLVIIIVSQILLIVFLKLMKNQNILIRTLEIKNVKPLKEINLTYLLTNIIPLIAFDFTKMQQIFSFLIIYFVLMMMYVKYSLISYNPATEFLGYTNYSAEIYNDKEKIRDIIILSKERCNHQNTFYNVKGIELDNDLWLITEKFKD